LILRFFSISFLAGLPFCDSDQKERAPQPHGEKACDLHLLQAWQVRLTQRMGGKGEWEKVMFVVLLEPPQSTMESK
jgi:hypothetical protein